MRQALALIVLIASATSSNVTWAQEIVYPKEVIQKQQSLPDTMLYEVLFRQAATFKDKADDLYRQGKDGSPFRKHLADQFQLTPDEVLSLDAAALQYRQDVAEIDNEIQQSVVRFQEQNSHLAKGQSVPPPPVEARYLLSERDDVARHARDRFHALLGDAEFARVDGLLKYRAIQNGLLKGGTSNEDAHEIYTDQAGALGYTSVDFNPGTNVVTAYSETYLYGTSSYYYQAAVTLSIHQQGTDSETSAAGVTWASATFAAHGTPGDTFYAYAEHSATIANKFLGDLNNDYYDLEEWGSYSVEDPSWFPFTGFSGPVTASENRFSLGRTYDTAYPAIPAN